MYLAVTGDIPFEIAFAIVVSSFIGYLIFKSNGK